MKESLDELDHGPRTGGQPADEQGEQDSRGADPRESTSLIDRITSELSEATIETGDSHGPVCKRCDDAGAACEDLFIAAGDPVYARACWTEWQGWELFGVYHADHSASLRSRSKPPLRPTATFEGTLERSERGIANRLDHDIYTLSDLSLVDLQFPDDLRL